MFLRTILLLAITIGTAHAQSGGVGNPFPLVPSNNLSDLVSAATARTNLGLGTVATQSAGGVAITGGTIDGVTIGATTPEPATVTTLGVNSTQTNYGNQYFNSGGNVFEFQPSAGRFDFKPQNNPNVYWDFGSGGFLDFAGALDVFRITPSQTVSNQQLVVRNQNGTPAYSGSNPTAFVPIYSNETWTGTYTGVGVPAYLGRWMVSSDSIAAGSGGAYLDDIEMSVGGATATGFRSALNVKMSQTATTNNASGGTYVAASFLAQMLANDNGTNPTPAGGMTSINPVSHWGPSATFTQGGSIAEFDIYAETGSNLKDKVGILIDQTSLDAVSGTVDDIGLAFDAQSNSTSKWTNGISFGRYDGAAFPVKSTGTLIFGEGSSGASFSVANGIDWHLGTFSGNSWNDGKFLFTGGGEFQATKITASGTAPGAGKMKFDVVAGTTGGTCKLIAYAGTSTTPTTVIDNVGSGC